MSTRRQVAVVGPCGVGKSCLVARLKEWEEVCAVSPLMEYVPTIGLDMILVRSSARPLLLFDVGGNERFAFLATNHIRTCEVIVAVYSEGEEGDLAVLLSRWLPRAIEATKPHTIILVVCTSLEKSLWEKVVRPEMLPPECLFSTLTLSTGEGIAHISDVLLYSSYTSINEIAL